MGKMAGGRAIYRHLRNWSRPPYVLKISERDVRQRDGPPSPVPYKKHKEQPR
jgi:hypothetical protein